MPSVKKLKFKEFDDSKYKKSCNPHILSFILILLCSLLFCESYAKCRLPRATTCKRNLLLPSLAQLDFSLSPRLSETLLCGYDVNFYARYTYGNRISRGIKLCHWNAENAHLKNKMNLIENLIRRYSPHILGISEANLLKYHDQSLVQIPGYELYLSSTMDNPNMHYSRIVVYKHSSIISTIRSDLMSPDFSSVWLQCGLPNKKKFLVCNLYREWQLMGQREDSSSKDIRQQLNRWVIFIDQFERALASGLEVYCMGDVNLDFMTWTKTNLNPDHKSAKLRPLINELFDRIISRGVKQCVTNPTRSWPGQPDSGLDHFYTNAPSKISPVQVSFEGSSDHRVIHTVRFTNNLKSQVRYVLKRSYKNFDVDEFKSEFRKISWWDVYCSRDINHAVDIFTLKFSRLLDKHAPVKKFQNRKRYAPWISSSTKYLMKERDMAQKWATATKKSKDWSDYKYLRNKVTKVLRVEKQNWQREKLEQANNNSKNLWSTIKGWLNWSSAASPSKLFHDRSMETSPRKIAEIMSHFYINKVVNIRANLPSTEVNPLQHLKQLRKNSTSVFSLKPVHPDLVHKIIGGLKNSKATLMAKYSS